MDISGAYVWRAYSPDFLYNNNSWKELNPFGWYIFHKMFRMLKPFGWAIPTVWLWGDAVQSGAVVRVVYLVRMPGCTGCLCCARCNVVGFVGVALVGVVGLLGWALVLPSSELWALLGWCCPRQCCWLVGLVLPSSGTWGLNAAIRWGELDALLSDSLMGYCYACLVGLIDLWGKDSKHLGCRDRVLSGARFFYRATQIFN